ncbi:hypothetical protein PBI_KALPINE_85 [Mycobacterium phage Kalpine]|nr:hypothetical protein PBI_KALPINE_85 [Mycobacterium phage Kalpine]
MKARYILAGLAAAVVVGNAPAIIAEAHAEVSAQCWAHLAEIPADQKTTPAGDRRYHLEHGEFSPCTEQDANEGSRPAPVPRTGEDNHPDEEKSRYCRKHWYC